MKPLAAFGGAGLVLALIGGWTADHALSKDNPYTPWSEIDSGGFVVGLFLAGLGVMLIVAGVAAAAAKAMR